MLLTTYDLEANALRVPFQPSNAKPARTEEVPPGVLLDSDDTDRRISIELLEVHDRQTAHPIAR